MGKISMLPNISKVVEGKLNEVWITAQKQVRK